MVPIRPIISCEIKLCLEGKREKKKEKKNQNAAAQTDKTIKAECCSARCILRLWRQQYGSASCFLMDFFESNGRGSKPAARTDCRAVSEIHRQVWTSHKALTAERERRRGREREEKSEIAAVLALHFWFITSWGRGSPYRQRSIIWANRVKLQHLT